MDLRRRRTVTVRLRGRPLMYPGVYVSAAVLTLQAMVGGSLRGARGHGVRLVLAGMVVQALAFIFWSEQLLDNTYMPGASFVDPLWGVSLLAIGAGGVMSPREEEELATDEEPGILGGVLPAGTFVLLVAALVHAEISEPPFAARVALIVGLLICGATLVARAALLEQRSRRLLENERIARSLLAAREADLGRLNQRLVEDSRRDALTGLHNRRALAEDLAGLEDGAASYTFALLDV